MIRHISTVACDAILRGSDGRHSCIGIFRNLNSPTLPFTKNPFGIIIELVGDAGDPFKISFEGNGLDQILAEGIVEPPVSVLKDQQWSLIFTGEMVLNFDTYGVFEIILSSNDEIIHSTPYGVVNVVVEEA